MSLVFSMLLTLMSSNMKVKIEISICTGLMLNDHSNPYIESTTVLSDICIYVFIRIRGPASVCRIPLISKCLYVNPFYRDATVIFFTSTMVHGTWYIYKYMYVFTYVRIHAWYIWATVRGYGLSVAA